MPLHNVTGGTPAAYNQQLGSAPLPYNQQLGSANASPFINSPVGFGVPSYGTNPAGLGAAHAGGLHNVTGGTPAAFNQQLSQVAYTQQLAPGATGLNNAGLGGNHTGMNMHPGGLHRITGGTAAAYNSQLGSTGGAASAHPVGTHRITGGTPAAYNSQLMGLMNNSSLSGNPSGSTSTFAGSPMGSSFINSPISQVGGNQNLFSSPTPASTGVQNTFVGSQASTFTRETEQWSLGGQQQLGGQHWGQQQLSQQQFGQQQLGQQWGQQQQQQLSGQQWGQQQFGQQQLGSQLGQQWTQEQLSHNLPSGAVTRAPIVQETVRTRVIEEIVPIIHREVPQPFIERVEQHSTEHVVQPTTMTKEVVGQRPLVSNIAGAPVL